MSEEKAKNPNEGHRERVLNRYINEGIDNFEPHEVLELLLHFTVQRKDTKAAAKQLIEKCETLENVFKREIADIAGYKIPNITARTAAFLKLVGELPKYISLLEEEKEPLDDDEKAGEYAITLLDDLPTEKLYLINLDKKLKVIQADLIAEGIVDGGRFEMRKIFESVIRNKASSVILAHNHPAGTKNPSKEDVEMTRDIARMLNGIGVKLQDHIIVTQGKYISLQGRGLI